MPKVQFSLYTNSAEYIKERLEQGLLDFGLLLEPIDVTKFDYICMKKKEKITKEDLLDEPLITTNRQSVQKELETWLGYSFSQMDIFATYNIIANVAMLVESGVASALTIEGAVNLFGSERMVFRPLFPELSMTSVLAWKKL